MEISNGNWWKPPRPRGFLSFLQLASAKGSTGGSPVEGFEGLKIYGILDVILLMDKIRLTTKDDDYQKLFIGLENHPRWLFGMSSINSIFSWI